jgi:hypothetical protein
MTPTAPSHIGEPPTKTEDTSPPRSLPPVVPSLPPPRHAAVPGASADLSAEHRWLADPRLTQLRGSVSDEHLVAVYRWGIDPTWTTNQIVGHVHATLEKKADRKVFEDHLSRCADKAALMELVHRTLAAQPPEVAERRARMLGLAR